MCWRKGSTSQRNHTIGCSTVWPIDRCQLHLPYYPIKLSVLVWRQRKVVFWWLQGILLYLLYLMFISWIYLRLSSYFLARTIFTSHVIKTKSRSHSINKFENQGYDSWLKYKQPRQESGLCWFSFARYSQKCVTIYRALYGDTMFVPFWGAQTWRPWHNKNICRWVSLLTWKCLLQISDTLK